MPKPQWEEYVWKYCGTQTTKYDIDPHKKSFSGTLIFHSCTNFSLESTANLKYCIAATDRAIHTCKFCDKFFDSFCLLRKLERKQIEQRGDQDFKILELQKWWEMLMTKSWMKHYNSARNLCGLWDE